MYIHNASTCTHYVGKHQREVKYKENNKFENVRQKDKTETKQTVIE